MQASLPTSLPHLSTYPRKSSRPDSSYRVATIIHSSILDIIIKERLMRRGLSFGERAYQLFSMGIRPLYFEICPSPPSNSLFTSKSGIGQ